MLNVYICIWLYTLQMYTASDCNCIDIVKPFHRYYCSGKPQRSHIIGTLRRESLVVWPGCLSVSQGNVFWQKTRLSRFFYSSKARKYIFLTHLVTSTAFLKSWLAFYKKNYTEIWFLYWKDINLSKKNRPVLQMRATAAACREPAGSHDKTTRGALCL